jgi:hypothetical protein
MGAATELVSPINEARSSQLVNDINGWVGTWVDVTDENGRWDRRRMAWPDAIADRAGMPQKKAVRS